MMTLKYIPNNINESIEEKKLRSTQRLIGSRHQNIELRV